MPRSEKRIMSSLDQKLGTGHKEGIGEASAADVLANGVRAAFKFNRIIANQLVAIAPR